MTFRTVRLDCLIEPAITERAGDKELPVLSMTMHNGLVDQAMKFKKRVASADTSYYKVVRRNQLVVGFPIDEGVLSFQDLYDEAIVSPAYDVWDLRDFKIVEPTYLERFLRSPRALAFYRAKLRGTTARRRTIPNDIFLNLQVPLPPIPEQRRIVEILDKADALRAKRRAAIAQLDALTQAIFLEMFGDPATNPKGWPIVSLGKCTAKIQIGPFGSLLHQEDYVVGGIPLVNPKHIQDGVIVTSTDESVMLQKYRELESYHLHHGDVVMGRRGEMGRCAIVNGVQPLLCGTGSLFIRPDNTQTTPSFLWAILSSRAMKEKLERKALGQTLPNLNSTIVEELVIPIPPIALQREFARCVDAVEKMRAVHHASLAKLDTLFASLQYRAFQGDL